MCIAVPVGGRFVPHDTSEIDDAGVGRFRCVREVAAPSSRVNAVSADKHTSLLRRAIGESRHHAAVTLVDRRERLSELGSHASAFGRGADARLQLSAHDRHAADWRIRKHPPGFVVKHESVVLKAKSVDDVLQSECP